MPKGRVRRDSRGRFAGSYGGGSGGGRGSKATTKAFGAKGQRRKLSAKLGRGQIIHNVHQKVHSKSGLKSNLVRRNDGSTYLSVSSIRRGSTGKLEYTASHVGTHTVTARGYRGASRQALAAKLGQRSR